ncbi:MAG: hypothetical protein F2947_03355 [Actinobacteria bacterium]|nr:hypothetical protein [Actinomycetota bacterium]MTA44335.1 hypothetical protein [Actinomycetota bacterium]
MDSPMTASTFVISITPFDANGRLDESALRAHLDRMADAGIGVYLGGGGSGEGFTLSNEESRRVLEIGVDQIGGRVQVRSMGIEPRTAQQMIDYLKMSAEVGVDAAQVYSLDPGHGHRPTAPEIEKYLEEVLSSTDLPCVVSSHMSVGYRLDPSLLHTLSQKYAHLIGVNCSHPDLAALIALRSALDERIELHVGGPAQALSALALGATGFLSSEGNLAPQTCAALIAGANANDYETATNAFDAISQLSTLLYRLGGIRATKGVLRSLGLPGGHVRPPQLDADEKSVASVLEFLDSLNFKAIENW